MIVDLRNKRLPARRICQPEDIAQAILFIATNPYVTGTIA